MATKEIATATPVEPDSPESNGELTPIEYQLEPIDDIDEIDPKEERAVVWQLDLFFLNYWVLGLRFQIP